MKVLTCLATLALSACASHAPTGQARLNAAGDVIELPASPPAQTARRFGFECGVLLRDDFTRFHEGECQRQIGARQAEDQPRELAVHEIGPEG